MLYACDFGWWRAHRAEVAAAFAGELWTVDVQARDQFGVRWIQGVDRPGLAPLDGPGPHRIHTGFNSGYQALGLAALWGARRILLLGFDFANFGHQVHWHARHPPGLSSGGGHYPVWIAAMNRLAVDLANAQIEVVNCSRRSALTCFPRRAIEACL